MLCNGDIAPTQEGFLCAHSSTEPGTRGPDLPERSVHHRVVEVLGSQSHHHCIGVIGGYPWKEKRGSE